MRFLEEERDKGLILERFCFWLALEYVSWVCIIKVCKSITSRQITLDDLVRIS